MSGNEQLQNPPKVEELLQKYKNLLSSKANKLEIDKFWDSLEKEPQ